MARGNASSLFQFCTRKGSFSRVKYLLLNHYHCFFGHYERSASQFYSSTSSNYVPVSSFSTSLVNPDKFNWHFPQSLKLFGDSSLYTRSFSSLDDNGEEESLKDGAIAESDCEYDADVGTNVGFDIEKPVNADVSALDEIGDEANKGINACNSAIAGLEERRDDDDADKLAKIKQYAYIGSRDPVELYRELRSVERVDKLRQNERAVINLIFNDFAKSSWASNQALAIYIGLSFFPTAVNKFRNFFHKKCYADIADYLVSLGPSDAAVKFLFPILLSFA